MGRVEPLDRDSVPGLVFGARPPGGVLRLVDDGRRARRARQRRQRAVVVGLVRRSLVQRSADAGAVTFRLLVAVRAFAAAQLRELGPSAETDARAAHLAWCVTVCERSAAARWTADEPAAVAKVAPYGEDMLAALAWCAEDADRAGAGLRLACSLVAFWFGTGAHQQGRRALERLLAVDVDHPAALRAEAEFAAGQLALFASEHAAADEHLARAIGLASEAGDGRLAAHALVMAARTAFVSGRTEDAAALGSRARALLEGSVHEHEAAGAAMYESVALIELGRLDEARVAIAAGLRAAALQPAGSAGWLLHCCAAEAALLEGDLGSARRSLDDAAAQRAGHEGSMNASYANVEGIYHLRAGDPRTAARYFGEVLRMARATDSVPYVVSALFGAAGVLVDLGSLDQATRFGAHAEAFAAHHGHRSARIDQGVWDAARARIGGTFSSMGDDVTLDEVEAALARTWSTDGG